MNLETVTLVIFNGRNTAFSTRNINDETTNYFVYGTVPLQVGLQVEVKTNTRPKIVTQDQIEVEEINIYDRNKTLIAKYIENS